MAFGVLKVAQVELSLAIYMFIQLENDSKLNSTRNWQCQFGDYVMVL